MFMWRLYAGKRFVYIISLNEPKYAVYDQGSTWPNHRSEDNMQALL